MKNNICVFTSQNSKPDLYVNVIVYLMAKYKYDNIHSVNLINIFDYPLDRDKESKRVNDIKENILNQMTALSEGKYLSWNWAADHFKDEDPNEIIIDDYYKKIYNSSLKTLERLELKTRSFLEDEIEDEIVSIIKENEGEYIFDLTGLAKKYFVQILMFLQDNGYYFSTFEIVNKTLSRDHGDLIHNLGPKYINYPFLNQEKYTLSRSNIDDAYLEDRYQLLKHKVSSWKGKISDGNTDEVIKLIDQYVSKIGDLNISNRIKLIANKWNSLRIESGTLNHETATTGRDKITKELLEFLDDLTSQFKEF